MLAGVLLGIGLVGTLDEVVLHQLLDWHHFVDRPDAAGALSEGARRLGLFADGLFHIASTALLAVGFLALLRSSTARLPARRVLAGVLLGAGGFNLYDAIVQHKLLGLHQVRRGVENLLPYDLAFGGLALVLLLLGAYLLRRPG